MIELVEMKKKVLTGLIEEWEKLEKAPSFTSLPHYNTLKFEIPSMDLRSLVTYFDPESSIYYWSDRSHEKEYLGINSIHQIGDEEFLSVIEDIVQENPEKAVEIIEKNQNTNTVTETIKTKIENNEAITTEDFEEVFETNVSPN